jgi:glycosyltransferase domain-containing protein
MLTNKITICIPTLNRSEFLNRALKYYNLVKFDGIILIGDSSNKVEKDKNKSYIKNYSNLNINYHHYELEEDHHDAMKIYRMLSEIKTPYITFSGDDDFQIPNGLEKCIDFLDNSPYFISAHGHRLNFTIDDTVYGNVIAIDMHDGYDWTKQDDQVKRWQEYLRQGLATTYYVHKTEFWKKYYAYSYKAKSNYIGNELIPCSLCSVLGKTKKIDCISTAFQRDNPIRKFSFEKTTLWDLINRKYWGESAKYFEEAIVFELSKTIDKNYAKEIFYREFWYHCLSVQTAQFNKKYSEQVEIKREPLDLTDMTSEDEFYNINKILSGSI